ncbi:hypothetical protein LSCM1_02176 [Leishmania martiniquensis]|uniref:Enriched in surface-labeled proteome protein 11 n=1 Tax=Leishmania martiniquensis TaxID=1580590 RepID=A0A836KEU1_9TRYP|nr:hypothetical protein LSCM1_02176 [Leishmania martiniquensis]
MSADLVRTAWRCRRALTAVALLFLLSLCLPPSGPAHSLQGDPIANTHCHPRLLFALAAEGRQCSQLQDLRDYGVNLRLLTSGTFYLNGEYFCAESAPAQYHCRCGVATKCKARHDPWGRDIGSCECCSPWMIGCFIVLGIFSVVCIFGAAYMVRCQGRWWCDGYAAPKTSFMPRRGPAVSCPPSRPLPPNLFRGHATADFTNATASPEAFSGTGAASASSPQDNSPWVADVGNEDGLGFVGEDGETRGRRVQPDWRRSQAAAAAESGAQG